MSPFDDIMSVSPNDDNRVSSALATMFARTPADLGLVIRQRRRARGLAQDLRLELRPPARGRRPKL